jgi:hypothetical protein
MTILSSCYPCHGRHSSFRSRSFLFFSFSIAMPRRKKSTVVNLRSGELYSGRTANNVCPRDLLEQKYNEALSETRPTTLYAENTIYHVERNLRLFEEYVPPI